MFSSTAKLNKDTGIELKNVVIPKQTSKLYFRDDFKKATDPIEYLGNRLFESFPPAIKRQQMSSSIFNFRSDHNGCIDVMGSEKDRSELLVELEKDTGLVGLKNNLNILYSRMGGELIPKEMHSLLDRLENLRNGMDSLPHLSKLDRKRESVAILEERILADLSGPANMSYKEIAKKHGTSTSRVSGVFKTISELNRLPSETKRLNRKLFRMPPRTEVKGFLDVEWAKNGYLATSWKELIARFKLRFPHLKDFSGKTISNQLRVFARVRMMADKRIQNKATPVEFFTKQLAVASVLVKLHLANERVIYFDQSSIQLGSFKSRSLGTTELKPIVYTRNFPDTLFFLAAIDVSGFVAIQFMLKSAASNEVACFIDDTMKRIRSEARDRYDKGCFVVMDNAGYHKTGIVKGLCKIHPMNIIYTVPCSPVLNIVEDFFLKVKQFVRSTHYENPNEIEKLLLKGVGSALAVDPKWMMRKFIEIMHEKVRIVLRMNKLTDVLK